jgi:hypothetical protein
MPGPGRWREAWHGPPDRACDLDGGAARIRQGRPGAWGNGQTGLAPCRCRELLAPGYPGEVACRYRYRDGGGEIGVIASVTQPFCRGCTRARLSAEGSLYTCLFAGAGHDLRGPLRGGASDEALRAQVASVWTRRADRYSELRSLATRPEQKVEMSHIGG